MLRDEADLHLSKVNLSRACQQVHALSSSAVQFTLQWKDLEKDLDARFENLEKKEKEIELRERSFETVKTRAEDLSMKFLEKEDSLFVMERRMKECEDQVRLSEEKLKSLQGLLSVTSQSVDSTCQSLISAQNSLNDCNLKLDAKKVELNNCCNEIASKEKEHGELIQKIGECDEMLKKRNSHVKSLEMVIEESNKQLVVEEKKQLALEKSIMDRSAELELMESEVEQKKKLIDDLQNEIRLKEAKSEEASRNLNSKTADFASKEKEAASLQYSLEELTKVLAEKERQFQNLDTFPKVKIESDDYSSRKEPPSPLDSLLKSPSSVISRDPNKLLSLVCAYFDLNDSVRQKVSKALQLAKDPADLVLKAISLESQFSFDIAKRSFIFLLGNLSRVSSEITFTPEVKNSALSMAWQWKKKLNLEETNDVLAFLQFLAIYQVVLPYFDTDEIQELLKLISDDKQDTLREALGLSGDQQGKWVVKIE